MLRSHARVSVRYPQPQRSWRRRAREPLRQVSRGRMLLPQILLLHVAAFEFFRGRTATRRREGGEAPG